MARASEAREWAPGALRGLVDSLYTPFSGPGGERVDEGALRTLIGHCLGALGHDGIWVGGLVGEYWSLSTAERKRVLEIGVEEVRAVKPGALVEACPASTNVLETVELARHAAAVGADICFIIPPYFEARGYEATREVLRYVVERTDIALGLFNTHAAGWILTPDECARLADEFPAICAVKNGMFRPSHTAALHRLAPELVIWECDMLAYRGGFLRRGSRRRASWAAPRTSTSCLPTGCTAPSGTYSCPTSCPRPSTTGTSRASRSWSPASTGRSGRPTSTLHTPTGDLPSRRRPPSSGSPSAIIRARAHRSRRCRRPCSRRYALPTRPPVCLTPAPERP